MKPSPIDGHLTSFQMFALIARVADALVDFPFLFAAPSVFQSSPPCRVTEGKVTLFTVPGISTKERNQIMLLAISSHVDMTYNDGQRTGYEGICWGLWGKSSFLNEYNVGVS